MADQTVESACELKVAVEVLCFDEIVGELSRNFSFSFDLKCSLFAVLALELSKFQPNIPASKAAVACGSAFTGAHFVQDDYRAAGASKRKGGRQSGQTCANDHHICLFFQ